MQQKRETLFDISAKDFQEVWKKNISENKSASYSYLQKKAVFQVQLQQNCTHVLLNLERQMNT